ncbi:MAG: transcription termination/antitermination protein NusA [Prevotella sp.]|nr:transcription termination/antitermination protein NusA [Prevotella sp.]
MAARKTAKEGSNLIETFKDFKETKNIDPTTMVSVLEESFRNVLAKIYGSDENIDVIVNPDKGDFEIYRNRVVVPDGEVNDENREISLSEAQKIEPDYEVGEDVSERVDFNKFGRRAILNLRQTLASKILELEHDSLYQKYKDRVGEVISGEVYQMWKREVLVVDDENNELILPRSEQIPRDQYRKGETIRAVIHQVTNDNNNPKIILSRTSNVFLQRLLEAEVPEIADGLITIRGIARMPGERAKIAVESYDDRIDPVGACVGVKGSRVHGIVRELCNENIDVIRYTQDTELYIKRALSPARVNEIQYDTNEMKARVFLAPEEVSLAIGKNGLNIKLASLLTGFTIDVFRDSRDAAMDEEDVNLEEFSDEIDAWIIDAIKALGYNTAKQVLRAPRERLVNEADLEEEQADEVLSILAREFANGDESWNNAPAAPSAADLEALKAKFQG